MKVAPEERGPLLPGGLAKKAAAPQCGPEQAVACCSVLALLVLLVAIFGGGPLSPPLPSAPTLVGLKPETVPTFFQAQDANTVMPLAPKTYPASLQGMIWMDQAGAYGPTDIPQGYQDGVIAFGDLTWPLDAATRTMYYSTSGPGWMWFNNADGYSQYASTALPGSYYFQWNEDYTEARLWQSTYTYGRNFFVLGQMTLFQFWIKKMPEPPAGACPPPADATKEQRRQCASWDRISCSFWCIGSRFGFNKPYHYYVYQVVDADGNKIEPYFTAMASYAASRWAPNATAAERAGIPLTPAGQQPGSVFVGMVKSP